MSRRRRRTVGQRIDRFIDAARRFIALFDPRARWGAIYLILAVDPRTGRVVAGYVGKTRQAVQARVDQHLERKPWARAVVDYGPVWSGRCLNITLCLREVFTIVTRAPIFNYQWNRWNPRRIPIPRQYEIYGYAYPPRNGPTWRPSRYGARRPHPDRTLTGRGRTAGAGRIRAR